MSSNPRFGIQNVPPLAVISAVAAAVLIVVVAVFVALGQKAPASPGASSTTSATSLEVHGGIDGSWGLDGISGDVSPTDQIIAAVWTKTVDNVAAGYGDLISLSIGGPVANITQATSASGLTLGFSISRTNSAGSDVYAHVFSSRNGECTVTMARTADGVAGTFTCSSITSDDGVTVSASGTFTT